MMKTCETCKYAIFKEEGYSNYTVEGTTFYCFMKSHPAAPFDRFYNQDKRLNYAETCISYKHGIPITMDVDKTDYDLTPIQICMYNLATDDDLDAGSHKNALTKMLTIRRDTSK
jgi:hypothetical protein